MDENNNSNRDTYDLLHQNFSLFENTEPKDTKSAENDIKNSGEIYFSAGEGSVKTASSGSFQTQSPKRTSNTAMYNPVPRQSSYTRQVNPAETSGAGASNVKSSAPAKKTSASSAKNKNGKKKKKKKTKASSILTAVVIVLFVVVSSLLLRIPIMGCLNDIIAINASDTKIRVTVEDGMDTNDIISLLGKKNLIYSPVFCKLASGILGFDYDDTYPAGTYDLSSDMGIEGMLREIRAAGTKESTVKVTFPEGYTVDQIIEKLSQSGVCSSKSLYSVLDDESLYEGYEFLSFITDKDLRLRALEGYLYPDTYEFYVGEDPKSVYKRFLDNFNNHWLEKYSALAEKSDYTIDEVLIVASILEKEANDAEQMPLIASILFNRLESSDFPFINCDSTAKYIEGLEELLTADGTYSSYLTRYDTYQQTGLPVGPICNPGNDAILAAFNPDSTNYYYFLHDKTGKIYVASTAEEHQANQVYMDNEAGD